MGEIEIKETLKRMFVKYWLNGSERLEIVVKDKSDHYMVDFEEKATGIKIGGCIVGKDDTKEDLLNDVYIIRAIGFISGYFTGKDIAMAKWSKGV